MADTLQRETTPPTGRIASPVPQYWNESTGAYEKVYGDDYAPRMQALAGKIADLATLLTRTGEVQASPTANTLLGRLKDVKDELDNVQTMLGETSASIVDAGAVGSMSAKIRRLSSDIGSLLTAFNNENFAQEDTLTALKDAFNAEDFSHETTLQALKDAFDAEVSMETYGAGAPGAHAGEPAGTLYLDVTNDDLYQSNGSAWVLKMEAIWD